MSAGKTALDNSRASPVMEVPMLNSLKRKRMESPEPHLPRQLQPIKKPRAEGEVVSRLPAVNTRIPVKSEREHVFTQSPSQNSTVLGINAVPHTESSPNPAIEISAPSSAISPFAFVHEASGTSSGRAMSRVEDVTMADAQGASTEDALGLTPLQQAIENEFNMQILMKHNELRLIEQELAKCQIALEQLRRCELRPYPGADNPSAAVSSGTGPAIAPLPGLSRPIHAAPHGVADGPYTQHYRQWLLRDPAFDPVPELHSSDELVQPGSRTVRDSAPARRAVQRPPPMPSRSQDAMQSLPNYPAHTRKEKGGPQVLRRSTDRQMVKLVCNNCLRSDFSSIQGFLNHCRIAHKVEYKTHDQAALDCGRLLNEEEAANLPPEAYAATTHKPSTSASRSSSASTTPLRTQHLVHSMNATHAMLPNMQRRTPSVQPRPLAPLPGLASAARQSTATPFTPAPQTPHLSAHFARYGIGGNLEQAFTAARQPTELEPEDDVLSPNSTDVSSPLGYAAGSRSVLGAARPGTLAPSGVAARPPSRKGYREAVQRHRPSPLAPAPVDAEKSENGEVPESPQDHSSNLSPHTADSNPGLVSDHEDDDHGSASEDEVPQTAITHSLGVGRGTCSDNMDIDVSVDAIDADGPDGVVIRRHSLIDNRGMRIAGSPSRKLDASGKSA